MTLFIIVTLKTHMKINPSWNIRVVDVPVCVSDNDDVDDDDDDDDDDNDALDYVYAIQDCDIENSHEDQS